jgi:hypothetical protein
MTARLASLIKVEADLEFRLDLREPLVPWPPPPGVTISLASAEQVTEAAEMRLHDTGEPIHYEYRDRLRRGHKCFVALMEGRVVGCNWLALGTDHDGPLTFVLRRDEVLCTGAFTASAVRGRSIHTALLHTMLVWAQRAGYLLAYTYVGLGNVRSAKTHARLRWKRSRVPRYVVVSSPMLRRTAGFCRELVIGLRLRDHPLAPGAPLRCPYRPPQEGEGWLV